MIFKSRNILALLLAFACLDTKKPEPYYTVRMESRPGLIAVLDEEYSRPVVRYLAPEEYLGRYKASFEEHEIMQIYKNGIMRVYRERDSAIGNYTLTDIDATETSAEIRFKLRK